MQIKALKEGEIKEQEEQVVNEDNELDKEKNKTKLLQNELENIKNVYNSKIACLEEQLKIKEDKVTYLEIKEKESLNLKNRIFNLEKQLESKPQDKELLKRIDEIVNMFIVGPFGYASEVFKEEIIERYYEEFKGKDYSQYSPEIAHYGKFFSSQLKTFKSNVSIRKINLRTIKELEDQKQQLEQSNQANLLKIYQLEKEKKEMTREHDSLTKQLNEENSRVKLIEKSKLELEATLKREQKELLKVQESQIKELENQLIDKDSKLEEEKNKNKKLQSELESDEVKIKSLESQIKIRDGESMELKNQVAELRERIKEENLNSEEKELLQKINEIISKIIAEPIDNAWKVYSEEEIDRYYKEFESKDYSQFSPEIALYGRFFLFQIRFFRNNLSTQKSMHKTKPQTMKEMNINKKFLCKRNDKFWTSFFFTLYISTYFKDRSFYLVDKLNHIIVPDSFIKENKIKLLETIRDESIYADVIKFLFRNGNDIIEDITEGDKQKIREKILLAYNFYPYDMELTLN